ncbi:PH domain-containing protein [Kangiella sediminilitoris]|uniref:Membrane-flanked domain protein n=1 Tax=Kangiella sediminilitoris TaxID=1144748 RepID=A0A1B3B7P9_9GAMM|nr:PH domain-containing protein [Kangiella sediminilitoris]AOE48808.1 Membrane-flanked domain protein [Kangiella sediminilitoris]
MQSKEERRLHKSSPIFILLDNVKKILFPILIALLGPGGSYWEYVALAIALVVSLVSIVQYRFYRYWLEPNQIRVKEGVIFRNERQVPYKRIQNLNLSQNPLHRILGVVTVQLESASGGKPEAVINVVDMAAVRELKAMVHGESDDIKSNQDGTQEQTQQKPALLRLPFGEIVRYGMITNKGLVILAVVFGFMSQLSDGFIKDYIETKIISLADWLSASFDSVVGDLGALTIVVYGLVIGILGLLGLWLLSITFALFKLHDFELIKRNHKLQATMGLMTRMQATIPMSRIQTLTVRNSLLHRWFKRLTVSVETAGGVNNEKQGLTLKEVAPLIRASERNSILENLQPELSWNSVDWMPIERAAMKRILRRLGALSLLLSVPLYLSHWAYAATAFVILIVLSFLYAKAYVKNTAYCLDQDMVGFKSGVIFKKETYVRLSKIQTVKVKESLFDRRYGMAKLEVDTAGAIVGAHHVEIPYIKLDEALRIQNKLVQRVSNKQFVW